MWQFWPDWTSDCRNVSNKDWVAPKQLPKTWRCQISSVLTLNCTVVKHSERRRWLKPDRRRTVQLIFTSLPHHCNMWRQIYFTASKCIQYKIYWLASKTSDVVHLIRSSLRTFWKRSAFKLRMRGLKRAEDEIITAAELARQQNRRHDNWRRTTIETLERTDLQSGSVCLLLLEYLHKRQSNRWFFCFKRHKKE